MNADILQLASCKISAFMHTIHCAVAVSAASSFLCFRLSITPTVIDIIGGTIAIVRIADKESPPSTTEPRPWPWLGGTGRTLFIRNSYDGNRAAYDVDNSWGY